MKHPVPGKNQTHFATESGTMYVWIDERLLEQYWHKVEKLEQAFNDQSQRLQLALAENDRLKAAIDKAHPHAESKPGCALCEP